MFSANSLLRRILGLGAAAQNRATPKKRSVQLAVEWLENREMMDAGLAGSSILATLHDGTLFLGGTEGNDTIRVRQIDNRLTVDGLGQSWDAAQISLIKIDAKGGDDVVDLNSGKVPVQQEIRIRAAIDGGSGDDLLIGTAAADYIFGHDGNDRLFGMSGDDDVDGGGWDDLVDGGEGNDLISDWGSDRALLVGGSGDDFIRGSSGVDHLYGQDGNDRFGTITSGDQVYQDDGPEMPRLIHLRAGDSLLTFRFQHGELSRWHDGNWVAVTDSSSAPGIAAQRVTLNAAWFHLPRYEGREDVLLHWSSSGQLRMVEDGVVCWKLTDDGNVYFFRWESAGRPETLLRWSADAGKTILADGVKAWDVTESGLLTVKLNGTLTVTGVESDAGRCDIDIARTDKQGHFWYLDANASLYRWNGIVWDRMAVGVKGFGVDHEGRVWHLGSDAGLKRWDGYWNPLAIAVSSFGIDQAGKVWHLGSDAGLKRWDGYWNPLAGAVSSFGIDQAGRVWHLGSDNALKRWDDNGGGEKGWHHKAVATSSFGVDHRGRVWHLGSDNVLKRWDDNGGGENGWHHLAGTVSGFGVDYLGRVWHLGSDKVLKRWDDNGGGENGWHHLAGAVHSFGIDHLGRVWHLGSDNVLKRWNENGGGENGWHHLAGAVYSFGIDHLGRVWHLGADNTLKRWDENGGGENGWHHLAGAVQSFVVDGAGVVRHVGGDNNLKRWNGSGWETVDTEVLTIAQTRSGDLLKAKMNGAFLKNDTRFANAYAEGGQLKVRYDDPAMAEIVVNKMVQNNWDWSSYRVMQVFDAYGFVFSTFSAVGKAIKAGRSVGAIFELAKDIAVKLSDDGPTPAHISFLQGRTKDDFIVRYTNTRGEIVRVEHQVIFREGEGLSITAGMGSIGAQYVPSSEGAQGDGLNLGFLKIDIGFKPFRFRFKIGFFF